MTEEMQNNRIIYLYRITCLANNKVYIGQTVDPISRWRGHRRDSANPKVPFQYAIKKYGAHNFEFEVIMCCKGQDNANELETQLVLQYNSFINNGKGYNATHGGMNAPKSEEWKQAMKNWYASLTPERRAEISKKQSISFTKYITENGHIALGTKRTAEQKANMSLVQQSLDRTNTYTEEVRRRMSDAHIGNTASEEQKHNMSIAIQANWDKRQAERLASGELKCNAPGCDVSGIAPYLIVNEVRYCFKHGQKLKTSGTLEYLPQHIQLNQSTEERKKCGLANIGKIPHNKINFTEEQINLIMSDSRSNATIAKELGFGKNVIQKLRRRLNSL